MSPTFLIRREGIGSLAAICPSDIVNTYQSCPIGNMLFEAVSQPVTKWISDPCRLSQWSAGVVTAPAFHVIISVANLANTGNGLFECRGPWTLKNRSKCGA